MPEQAPNNKKEEKETNKGEQNWTPAAPTFSRSLGKPDSTLLPQCVSPGTFQQQYTGWGEPWAEVIRHIHGA